MNGDPQPGKLEQPIHDRPLRAKLARDGGPYWAGHYFYGINNQKGEMVYEMIRRRTRLRDHITIPEIQVTNGTCGIGNGWDVLFFGTVIDHHDRKTDAQRAAERCLDDG